MRTELQYNLQKARALATELRCTLETINELGQANALPHGIIIEDDIADNLTYAENLEGYFDDLEGIGEGFVALTVEPFA